MEPNPGRTSPGNLPLIVPVPGALLKGKRLVGSIAQRDQLLLRPFGKEAFDSSESEHGGRKHPPFPHPDSLLMLLLRVNPAMAPHSQKTAAPPTFFNSEATVWKYFHTLFAWQSVRHATPMSGGV